MGAIRSAINARPRASHSFSSNGEASDPRRADGNWTAGSGVNFRSRSRHTQSRQNSSCPWSRSHDYAGREQAYVKHIFLERYLEALIFKTASTYTHIVYVDGFAGPWQSANERFDDTSFGIALNALRSAKESGRKPARGVA